nr:MAG TPA: hypothetical protein [Caudoviricetes sp.]
MGNIQKRQPYPTAKARLREHQRSHSVGKFPHAGRRPLPD